MERHVLLDLILGEFLHSNFVKYNSFPFSGEGKLGKETYQNSIFVIWNYYRDLYKDSEK